MKFINVHCSCNFPKRLLLEHNSIPTKSLVAVATSGMNTITTFFIYGDRIYSEKAVLSPILSLIQSCGIGFQQVSETEWAINDNRTSKYLKTKFQNALFADLQYKSDYMFCVEKAPVFRNQSSQTSHLFHPFGGKRNPIRRLKHIESYVNTEQ